MPPSARCRPSTTSRASTPRSTRPCRRRRRRTRSRRSGGHAGRCAGSDSTGCRTPTRPGARPSSRGLAIGAVRAVSCHLGAGASLCAIEAGRSVDTTMGFTPLEGLVMAHACRKHRPGARAVAPGARRTRRRRGARRARAAQRPRRAVRDRRHARRCSSAGRTPTPMPCSRSTSTPTRCAARSGRWSRRCSPSTSSCSPVGSVSTRRRCAPRRGCRSTRTRTARRRPTARSLLRAPTCGRSSITAREDVEIARQVRALLDRR